MTKQQTVSNRFVLCKMKHRDIYGSIKRRWHLINDSGTGSNEYTLCGLATPDSHFGIEDFETEEYKRGGKITCEECLRLLNWCKSVS